MGVGEDAPIHAFAEAMNLSFHEEETLRTALSILNGRS